MSLEDPGSASFAGIGGLNDQVRELREVIELPLMNPELFEVRPASRVRIIIPNQIWLTQLYFFVDTASGYQSSKGSLALWSSRDWKDSARASGRRNPQYQFLKGRQ